MFGRARSYRNETTAEQLEVDRLRADIARLERALVDVIEASDHALGDVVSAPAATVTEIRPDTGFATAWTMVDVDAPSLGDDFFNRTQIDERARSWLLASN